MGLTYNTGFYNAAAEHYGVDDIVMTKIPRQRFQFMVEITINETIPSQQLGRAESYGRQFFFHRVQGVTLPDYQYNLVKTNQYNRLRWVPTRSEITPATITFYDTKDNQFQDLMQAYAQHHFHGHSISEDAIASYDTITQGIAGVFGARTVPSAQRYFFPSIRIISVDTANSGRVISMYNCMITNINHDRLDYSSSDPIVWSVQFQPEYVNLQSGNDSTVEPTITTNDPIIPTTPTNLTPSNFTP
jgi:hypothetical protein